MQRFNVFLSQYRWDPPRLPRHPPHSTPILASTTSYLEVFATNIEPSWCPLVVSSMKQSEPLSGPGAGFPPPSPFPPHLNLNPAVLFNPFLASAYAHLSSGAGNCICVSSLCRYKHHNSGADSSVRKTAILDVSWLFDPLRSSQLWYGSRKTAKICSLPSHPSSFTGGTSSMSEIHPLKSKCFITCHGLSTHALRDDNTSRNFLNRRIGICWFHHIISETIGVVLVSCVTISLPQNLCN